MTAQKQNGLLSRIKRKSALVKSAREYRKSLASTARAAAHKKRQRKAEKKVFEAFNPSSPSFGSLKKPTGAKQVSKIQRAARLDNNHPGEVLKSDGDWLVVRFDGYNRPHQVRKDAVRMLNSTGKKQRVETRRNLAGFKWRVSEKLYSRKEEEAKERALKAAAKKRTAKKTTGKIKRFYVDAYSRKDGELLHQSAVQAVSVADARNKTRKAYRDAGDDVLNYKFKVYQSNPATKTRRNVEGYTDETGFHPIRGSKGYSDFEAGELRRMERLHKARTRRNPSLDAALAEKFRTFRGFDPTKKIQIAKSRFVPQGTWVLGQLPFLDLMGGRRQPFGPGFHLVGDAKGDLHIVKVNRDGSTRAPFKPLDPATRKNGVTWIDEVKRFPYKSQKVHIGKDTVYVWIHKAGEEGGDRPIFGIDDSGFPVLRGGSYELKEEGIRN